MVPKSDFFQSIFDDEDDNIQILTPGYFPFVNGQTMDGSVFHASGQNVAFIFARPNREHLKKWVPSPP